MVKRIVSVCIALMLSAPASAGDALELTFTSHLQKNLVEQSVQVEREAGSGQVYRVTPVDQHRYLNSPVYGTDEIVALAPSDHGAVGPYQIGKALGFTLGDWLAATGTARYRCDGDDGKVEATFDKLVPNGVYTMWYVMAPRPPLEPFKVLPMPLGARDATQSSFGANAKGHAKFAVTFSPCLQLSGRQVDTFLAIVWHSDGKTYGASPGPFSKMAHIQFFTEPFPIEGR